MVSKEKNKIGDIRLKSDKELEVRLMDLRKEQFNLRFQRATGQLSNSARVTTVRKEIAKIMTVANERKRAPVKAAAKK